MENSTAAAALHERAVKDFSTYEVIFLGIQDGRAAWDVKDVVATSRVAFATQGSVYTCDCAGFTAGQLGTCVHVEVVKEHRIKKKGNPARPPVAPRETAPAPATPPSDAPANQPAPPAPPEPPAAGVSTLPGLVDALAMLAVIADAQGRQADALEKIARYMAPKAPNYRHTLREWRGFDWGSIDAEVVRSDDDGVALVSWGGYLWARRAPDNKFAEAVWYSRAEGHNDEGGALYVRLITFGKQTEAEPMGRKAQKAAEGGAG
jgi:hypothetical protein